MTLTRAPNYLMLILSFVVALVSYRFVVLGLSMAYPDMPGHIQAHWLAFSLHVTAAPISLVVGAVQLFPSVRAKRPVLHRWAGRVYGVSVLVAGLSGFIVAMGAAGGLSAQLGFGVLSVLWIVTTVQGVRFARSRQFARHRRWMARSFALTFAAVTLRLYLPVFFVNGFDYTQASVYVAWICWIPNLLVVEIWHRKGS